MRAITPSTRQPVGSECRRSLTKSRLMSSNALASVPREGKQTPLDELARDFIRISATRTSLRKKGMWVINETCALGAASVAQGNQLVLEHQVLDIQIDPAAPLGIAETLERKRQARPSRNSC